MKRKFADLFYAIALLFTITACDCNCPCIDAVIESENYSKQRNLNISTHPLILCIVDARNHIKSQFRRLILQEIRIKFITLNEYNQGDCNVLLKVVHNISESDFPSNEQRLCPGECRPVPEITILHTWLRSKYVPKLMDDVLVTCTLSGSMLPLSYRDGNNVEAFLHAIFWRRIMECYERKFWRSRHLKLWSPPSRIPDLTKVAPISLQTGINEGDHIMKRKILSIVIWIGSREKMVLIQEQAKVLLEQPIFGVEGVLGWAATDDIYPCRSDHTQCKRGGLSKYKYLPGSAINYMSPGWRCAQRRPLRSLAHILTLVNPTFVVLLDDDTYLNYMLLMKKYGNYLIDGDMIIRSLVMGELGGRWGDTGHLSKWGIYAGGAGYIIGRKAVEALVSYEVKYFNGEGPGKLEKNVNASDTFRSNKQIYSLSVYREGMESSIRSCGQDKPSILALDSCILSTEPYTSVDVKKNLVIPIAVRLIDFCVNLMANENTCHHRYAENIS